MAKILVSLDQRLLDQINREARERGMSRSALIAELAARSLGERKGPGADPEAHQAIARLRELMKGTPPGDSTEWIRQDRDSH